MVEVYAGVFGAIGLLGVAFYLGAYAALQFGFIRGSSYVYTLLNLAGAVFVLISLAVEFNLASALIQISWISISVIGLSRLYLRSRRLRFTEEELALLNHRLPNLPKLSAREFLNSGGWVELPNGEELLREGVQVEHLFYLANGTVSVSSGGKEIAQVDAGFLGEINVLEGAPASATVKTICTASAFVISRQKLLDLMAKDDEFRSAIEASLSRELGQKLVETNRRLLGAQS